MMTFAEDPEFDREQISRFDVVERGFAKEGVERRPQAQRVEL